MLIHVVQEIAFQVFAIGQWLRHGRAPCALDGIELFALIGCELLQAQQRFKYAAVSNSLAVVTLHGFPLHAYAERRTKVNAQPGAVVTHALQTELNHLLRLDRIPIVFNWRRDGGRYRATAGKARHAVGQARQSTAAVFLDSGLAQHKGTGVQRAWYGVLIAGARNRTARLAREGRRHRTTGSETTDTSTNQTAAGVHFHTLDVDRMRA